MKYKSILNEIDNDSSYNKQKTNNKKKIKSKIFTPKLMILILQINRNKKRILKKKNK